MRININTTLLNDLWIHAHSNNLEEIKRITSKLKQYENLRYLAKECYQKGDKTQYKVINEQIKQLVLDEELNMYTD